MKRLQTHSLVQKVFIGTLIVALVFLLTLFALRIAYVGRVLPGVSVNGVYLGGLTYSEALSELNKQTEAYRKNNVEVLLPTEKMNVSAGTIGVEYNNSLAAQMAMHAGRKQLLWNDLTQQFLYVIGQGEPMYALSYNTTAISNFTESISPKLSKPVVNAQFYSEGNALKIKPGNHGSRINFSSLADSLQNHFGELNQNEYIVPTTYIEPQFSESELSAQKDIIEPFIVKPLVLTHQGKTWSIDATTLESWLSAPYVYELSNKNTFWPTYLAKTPKHNLAYDSQTISNYISGLAGQINITPVDAELTIAGGRATVFKQSRDGKALNVAQSVEDITKTLATRESVEVPLTVEIQKAEVSNENINNLGINELISEGVSYFPGSSSNRMQNVRTGASKFNGILVRPGEVFSFNKYLGEVSAATGYAEGIVILQNREERQYGGGLCQVSSTAYRAALLAGLPIVSRTNHSFAVDYYTQPYGVPGVDATIYLPSPDMQFRNDTGKYILIQTEMIGTTLKFRFYGTKTKTGVIRGPFFIFGSLDHTQPSQTVFYRDVLDMSGKVVKTDTTTTYYRSSLDFPLTN